MTFFISFICFVIIQRLIELVIARRNEKWMKNRGAVEVASDHYKWFICLHSLFLLAIIFEVYWQSLHNSFSVNWIFLFIFICTQVARVWCILSLGKFWNTKIIVLQNVILMKRGPYRWLRHPNYIIVLIELIVIPMMFHAYFSAVIFPTLHILLLMIRIPEEEKALGDNIY